MSHYLTQLRIEEPIYLGPDDISFLRARISAAESQTESLENKLKRVCEDEAQTSDLTRRKDAKLVEIASFRNILWPIRRIPLELLSEIFKLSCVPKDGWNARHDIVRRISVLCRVWIAWRRAAHATPRLWSKFCLDLYQYQLIGSKVGWVKEWISRSQKLPLDVYLHAEARFREGVPATTKILEYVLSFRHRIRLLNLLVGSTYRSYLPILQRLPQSSFPLLERISLEYCHSGHLPLFGAHTPPDKIDMLIGAPKLRHVDIVIYHPPVADLLLLPIEQLNSLKILNPANYRDLLPRCEGLVHLDIDWSTSSFYGTFPTNHFFLLPALKSLRISFFEMGGHSTSLLSCLTSPLLEELTLHQPEDYYRHPFVDPAGFQRRSATALSALTLQNFQARDGQLFAEELTAVSHSFLK